MSSVDIILPAADASSATSSLAAEISPAAEEHQLHRWQPKVRRREGERQTMGPSPLLPQPAAATTHLSFVESNKDLRRWRNSSKCHRPSMTIEAGVPRASFDRSADTQIKISGTDRSQEEAITSVGRDSFFLCSWTTRTPFYLIYTFLKLGVILDEFFSLDLHSLQRKASADHIYSSLITA